jgi:glycosyltransferase involved in cell wall biosynthesis
MKISCLTITKLSRIHLLRRCLKSYSWQSFDVNWRELIVVHHDGRRCTNAIKKLLAEYEIEAKIIEAPVGPLGQLRNLSIEHAAGDILCQWDDDDFFHPDRLKIQSAPFNNADYMATSLSKQLYWFFNTNNLYIRSGGKEGIHGTLMFRNDLDLRYDPLMFRGEDTKLIQDILIKDAFGICCINDHPELYVRTFHGLNTWDYDHHHKRLIRQAKDSDWIERHKKQILEWMLVLDIPAVNICNNMDQIIFTT